jgi:hypothetical protein
MPLEKPKKPTELVPRAFGGIKNNFSDDLQSTGFEPNIPQTYNGDNLNYHLDATGKELDYVEKVVDYINEMPIGSALYVNSNNQLDYTNVGDFANKADKDLANTGLVTNCLLEVPQNIKLELNNGTLTLKSGSTVIVPNGANNFEHKSSTSDLSRATFGTQSGENIYIELVVNSSTFVPTGLTWSTNSNTTVGTTAPTSGVFYDTANNEIYNYTSSGKADRRSLPVALVKMENGIVTKIEKVFNGFGCFGNCFFSDIGIKFLSPNGRNQDRTLKNREYVTSVVRTSFPTGNRYNQAIVIAPEYFGPQAAYRYDEFNNYNYRSASGSEGPQITALVGRMSMVNDIITQFDINEPFRAVEKYDIINMLSANNGYKTIGSNYVAFYSDEAKTNRTLLIQWGVISNQTANPYTLTFPQAWANKNYSIVATDWEGSGTYAVSFDYGNRTVTSCNVHFNINGGRGFGWIAIGK